MVCAVQADGTESINTITIQTGSVKEIEAQTEPIQNCRFYAGIELPEGWYFSYKVQKYIVCSVPLMVSRDSIKQQSEVDE